MNPVALQNITKSFLQGDRRVIALDDISLELHQGQFLAIMGASGSGKSTLLHLMAGLAQPDSGTILVDGTDITEMSDRKLTLFRRRHIGLVFQSFNLIPTLSAEQNIALPLLLDRHDKKQTQDKVDRLLDILGIAKRRHHRPDALSGGEQQRVAIGRALVTDAAVLLADEPTGNLDSHNSHSVCELLRELCTSHGRSIVMVTHEPSVACYAQRVAIIRDGHLVDQFDIDRSTTSQDVALRYQEHTH